MTAKGRFIGAALRAVSVAASVATNCLTGRRFMSVSATNDWSIGIYKGTSAWNFFQSPDILNPVLTAGHVTDVRAEFVADPFWIKDGPTWYMFFEVMNSAVGRGEIGLATSRDCYNWKYDRIVLREPFHLSYPFVFKCGEEFFLVPESAAANRIALYRARDFPHSWEYIKPLVEEPLADHALFRRRDTWWLFAGAQPQSHDGLRLFFADELTGPWTEHPKSPIVRGDARIARPGGRMLVLGETVIRYAQDCFPTYGRALNAFEIVTLSKMDYQEHSFSQKPVLSPGKSGWNMHGMHHIDPYELQEQQWIACIDGYKRKLRIEFEY